MVRLLPILLILISGCISINRLKSYQEIDQLKESLLLIQLEFPQRQIDLLNETGLTRRAKRLQAKHEAHHLKLAKAFSDFRFCKIYFYYSDPESINIFDHTLKLYNEGLFPTNTKLSNTPFFIAKFTTKQFDNGLDYEELREGFRIYKEAGGPMSYGFPDFIPMTNYGSDGYYKSTINVFEKRLNIYHRQSNRFKSRTEKRKIKNSGLTE